ncbi:MAG: transposase [Deltaproteobacteria bacterium]
MGLLFRRGPVYERHRPETTALYEVVRDNLDTLYAAIDDGALDVRIPKHAKKELDAFLDCGLLCRGFAKLWCSACNESRLVAFSCKGRGFCPSCMGRRMCATATTLVDHVLPEVALRQWVLTFPFAWRRRLAKDGALFADLTRLFVETVHAFYSKRAAAASAAKTGAITVVQRTSSDLRLNPHLHVIVLDGAYHEAADALLWEQLPHLRTRDVGEVLEHALRRIDKHLRRRGLLELATGDDDSGDAEDPEDALAASAVSGRTPPAGPQWTRGLPPNAPSPLTFDKPLCASLDGFTLHAATRAGSHDLAGREALLRYALRPPLAKEHLETRADGLVRITLKRAYADGTFAVDMDPLSLICRLAASVPPPRFHTVKCSQAAGRRMERRPPDANGVLAPASSWRARIAPKPSEPAKTDDAEPERRRGSSRYTPWAELLMRTFGVDVLECPKCKGRMRLLAMVTERAAIRRFLTGVGELVDVPERSPSRGPPYWKSTVLRRKAMGDAA